MRAPSSIGRSKCATVAVGLTSTSILITISVGLLRRVIFPTLCRDGVIFIWV